MVCLLVRKFCVSNWLLVMIMCWFLFCCLSILVRFVLCGWLWLLLVGLRWDRGCICLMLMERNLYWLWLVINILEFNVIEYFD